MYICICNAVTERQIRACAEDGACTLGDLECQLGVGAGCGRCRHAAKEVLIETRSDSGVILAGTQA
jgi:bacterioferritin-associated ferredoxin